jgi:hypothetical protein
VGTHGFGTFKVTERAASIDRNPPTGEQLELPTRDRRNRPGVAKVRRNYLTVPFSPRGDDKDLASVVWEIGLAALQAVAVEAP